MTIFLLLILPAVLAGTIVSLRDRRLSLSRSASAGLLTFFALIILDLLVLLPLERMHLISSDGILTIAFGKSALVINLLCALFIGFFLAFCTKQVYLPRRLRLPSPGRALILALVHLFLFALLLLSQAYIWAEQVYPNANLEEIMFYLRMPLQGTAASFVSQVIINVLLPAAIGFVILEIWMLWPAKNTYFAVIAERLRISLFPLRIPLGAALAVMIVWFAGLLYAGDQLLDIQGYFKGHFSTSELIETEYVAPSSVALTFPEEKRNLITIYIESGETTPQDVANGGILENNLIPEMTEIARENISFSRSELIEGASVAPGCGWTIAGLVAQTAGIPLKLYENKGLVEQEIGYAANSASTYQSLLPGAVTLGDILAEQGYRNVFMAGSDFTFGGRRVYFTEHGDYEVLDLLNAYEVGKLPEDYYEYWGFEDFRLYAYAKETLSELSQSSQPFHFAMLTVDTHSPGYRCPKCPTDYINADRDCLNYADTLRCSSIQLDEFLSWCKTQSFYDDTTIVVTGDHASMQSYFYSGISNTDYDKKHGSTNRPVYNAFINSVVQPVSETNRIFTTIDFFPTVLASMGVQIEGDRLGLGTNLFSERQTLSEEYGEEALFEELNKRSTFYEDALLYP